MALAPADGGSSTGTVPGTGGRDWTYQGAVSTIQVNGPDVVDAVTLNVTESAYNIPFRFTVTRKVYDAEGWKALASDYAGVIELVATYDGVFAIVYAQDTNAANDLVDTLIVTVGTDDGLNAIDVQVPLIVPFPESATAKINAAWQQIQSNLAGG